VQLLPANAAPDNPTWNRLKSCGGASAKINLTVSELPRFSCLEGVSQPNGNASQRPELLGTVHLCSGMASLERAWDEASRGYPSTEPMIEMYLQTATDSSLTPPGRHILSLFVQYFPYNLAAGLDLAEERERFADRVIEICGRYAPNVPSSVLHRQVLTPRDLEERFGLTGGHIFHGDLLPPTLFADRNPAKLPGGRTGIRGLYLCGSGTHPGGCVMGVPGRIAAEAVLADIAPDRTNAH
jgi:phytoene dehydrogenase-like protein